MIQSTSRVVTAIVLAALASGVPRLAGERVAIAAVACACSHGGRSPCRCLRGSEQRARPASCMSSCCRTPESSHPVRGATDPFVLSAAEVLPVPDRLWIFSAPAARLPERADEPETPPPRIA